MIWAVLACAGLAACELRPELERPQLRGEPEPVREPEPPEARSESAPLAATESAADEWCLSETQSPSKFAASARYPDYPSGDPRQNPYGPECVVAWVADTGGSSCYNHTFCVPSFELRVKAGPPDRWRALGGPLGRAEAASGLIAIAVDGDRRPVVAWTMVGRYWSTLQTARWNGSEWQRWSFARYGVEQTEARLWVDFQGAVQLRYREDGREQMVVLQGDSWVISPVRRPARPTW